MEDRYSYSYRRGHTEISHSSHFVITSSNNPSFSSTLLEEICRSIDQGGEEIAVRRDSMRKKRDDVSVRNLFESEEEMANYQRVCLIEKWMEKKVTEKIVVHGKSMASLQVKMSRKDRQHSNSSSSSSSCSGSSGGFFSSSEAESFLVKPTPVRTGGEPGKNSRNSEIDCRDRRGFSDQLKHKMKHEDRTVKTKSRPPRIYGDSMKAKQSVSPAGKVAAFLNSIFTSGNLKKLKIASTSGDDSPSLKSSMTSACSSASSFSRSCLSKTPSSKCSAAMKRSVRFSPVSVIVNEDCQPCGQKSLNQENNINNSNNDNINFIKTATGEEHMMHIMEKNRQVTEAAGDFLMNYRKTAQMGCEFEIPFDLLRKIDDGNRGFDDEFDEEEDEDDDDFDAASYASSDLFELDNLSTIGVERYREELPVYETTNLDSLIL